MAKVLWIEVDKGLEELKKTFKSIAEKDAHVKVGVFGDDKKARRPDEAITNVDLAVIHEFGAPKAHIPARPFIGGTFEAKKSEYAAAIRKGLEKVYSNELTVKQLLGAVGAQMAADIKRRVRDGEGIVQDAPSTKQRKGRKRKNDGPAESPKALIDTGRLLNSVTWDVMLDGEKMEGES